MRYFRSNKIANRKSKVVSRKYAILPFAALAILFAGCKNYYKGLKPGTGDVKCIEKFTPQFTKVMYSAYVDVTKHHFSGILLMRLLPDGGTRIVFTNEVGVKFFDFGFGTDGTFTKFYVLDKLNKKIVINALRNDLNLILLHPNLSKAKMLQNYTSILDRDKCTGGYILTRDSTDSILHAKSINKTHIALKYITVLNKKGNDYYITDVSCSKLVRIERASKRKPMVIVEMMDYKNGTPDSVNISHKNFNFNIALKHIENN